MRPVCRCSDVIIPKKKLPVQQLGIIMPSAVMMEENFDKLLDQCETQELEVSTGCQNAYFLSCCSKCQSLLSPFDRFVCDSYLKVG